MPLLTATGETAYTDYLTYQKWSFETDFIRRIFTTLRFQLHYVMLHKSQNALWELILFWSNEKSFSYNMLNKIGNNWYVDLLYRHVLFMLFIIATISTIRTRMVTTLVSELHSATHMKIMSVRTSQKLPTTYLLLTNIISYICHVTSERYYIRLSNLKVNSFNSKWNLRRNLLNVFALDNTLNKI